MSVGTIINDLVYKFKDNYEALVVVNSGYIYKIAGN